MIAHSLHGRPDVLAPTIGLRRPAFNTAAGRAILSQLPDKVLDAWLDKLEPKVMTDCPACGEKVKPGVAVCRSCGAVLDAARAAQFGLAPAGHEEGRAGAGATPPVGPPAGSARQEEGRVVVEHATTQPRRR